MDTSLEYGKWLSNPSPGEEVVISGIAGLFPESNNVYEFQENLFNKIDMVTDDDRRWKLKHPEIPPRNGKIYNIDKLDAGYFGIHYRQANHMDPMTRKFLECAVEAIMDAGVNPKELEGSKTAVCVGACHYADMELLEFLDTQKKDSELQNFIATGYLRSFIAHRVSFCLKLKGVSFTADTACSSSFNALDLGFTLIRMGKCDNVIVGGANIIRHPNFTIQFSRLGVLSPDGTCKVFDDSANGYVRSESIGCVFLQKEKNARRIYAQIIHSKVNCDGFKSLGITYPSNQMQKKLMSDVLKECGVRASEISFMEAHGTGTKVGDPEETQAIDEAIAQKRNKTLLVGSVKCSIGHTEPASGLNSLTKVIIAMETGQIPPNIHFKNLKKGLRGFEEGRMKVVTEMTPLDGEDAIIAINNFGFGGNNVHLLVRRHNKPKNNKKFCKDDMPRIICLSGRTKKAVLKLFEEVNERLDYEHIRLLHQLFQHNVLGHQFRGFIILSRNGPNQTDIKRQTKKRPVHVILGKLENKFIDLYHDLLQFPCFQQTVEKINKAVKSFYALTTTSKVQVNTNYICSSFIVQMGLIEIFKMLQLKLDSFIGDLVGEVVSAYYYDSVTLEDAVFEVCKIITTAQVQNESIDMTKLHLDKTSHFTKKYRNSIILNISGKNFLDTNCLSFSKKEFGLLGVLGRLYLEGYNFQLQKLYPPVEYPVSRNTPMISPSIQWQNHKSWYTYKFGERTISGVTQVEYILSTRLYKDDLFLLGHVIDGRNLVPAMEYLRLVWKTFVGKTGLKYDDFPVVLENCKFIRAVALHETKSTNLVVSIQRSSGNFEVIEKDSLVVSGRIFSPTDVEKHFTDLPSRELTEDQKELLEQDEVYRELSLRGYNYRDLFKGVVRCNVDATIAFIKWENNWTTFLDNILQMRILQIDTRSLYIPVGIKKLTINPMQHSIFVKQQKDSVCPVYSYRQSNIIKCGGIEISGIQATAISKKRQSARPVLEKYVFVPNKTQLDIEESVRVITQIVLENTLECNFKAVEILDDYVKQNLKPLAPLFCDALDDLPLVTIDFTVSTKDDLKMKPPIKTENYALTSSSNLLLITATKLFENPTLLNQALNALSPNGFLLSREEPSFIPENIKKFQILTLHNVGHEKLVLIQKTKDNREIVFVEVNSRKFDWVPQLQKALEEDSDVVIYCQDSEDEGVLGLVNCLRREPNGNRIRCFFMMDVVPKFDVETPFYKTQFKKQMVLNVYKRGEWGTFRHLLLEEVRDVEGLHFFVQNTVKGDLLSLKWVEGFLSLDTRVPEGSALVFPFYSALNFKDIVIASGRVAVDNFVVDRMQQESYQGYEFAGVDINGKRVMGMADCRAIATMVLVDKSSLVAVPDEWTLEEASAISVVYSTLIYGLLKVANIKPGMSILIHSGTGGVGLAAINTCLYHNLEIYVTVGSQQKHDYIKENFPQIPENHIGNSRDESFEQMIKTQTKDRGVDVVLNSLSDEKLRASIRCVASGGHFLEIGKYDLGNDASINLLLLERNVNYHGIMLDHALAKSPEIKQWILDKFREGMRLGYIKKLPRTIFQSNEIVEAFKFMTTGKHIGKVLIKIRNENEQTFKPTNFLFRGHPRFTCNPQKCYIILGGLGGIGLELADWLYLRGAKKLVLVSRQGIQSGYQKQRINIWKSYGVIIHISTKNITTKEGCLQLVDEAHTFGPVDAIFNLAVVLKDALFKDQNEETFLASLDSKAKATIYLDQITREKCPELRNFVVFSSVSCGRGNAGQTNYGMANSIMERICERRKLEGFPGLAIQWGVVGDVGLVAKMQKENKELVIGGTLQQKISSCLQVLDQFLKQDHPVVASMVVAEKTKKVSLDNPVDVVAYILGIKDIKSVGLHTTFAELGTDSITGTEIIQILEKDFDIYVTNKEIRSLTFARLIELENDKNNSKENVSETKNEIDIFLNYVPQENIADLQTIQIPSKIENSQNFKTVFLLPSVDGDFQRMKCLTDNLAANILGVQYINHHKASSIKEYAEMILPFVEEHVSKQAAFYIIGYSLGSIIAIELVSLLESKGLTGHLVLIEGSYEYVSAVIYKTFPLDQEHEFQTLLVFKVLSTFLPKDDLLKQKEKFLNCKNLDERCELGLSIVPPEAVQKKDLMKNAFVGFYNRIKAAAKYKFGHEKIKSQVYLFKSKTSMVSNFANDFHLSKLCDQPVKIATVEGDHLTILKQNQLSDEINKLFEL